MSLGKISYLIWIGGFFLSNKVFLTYKQQIQRMKDKNVLISDDGFAKEILNSISYYNIMNGYKDIFETYIDKEEEIEKFTSKVPLEQLHQVYIIDNAINNLLFKYIIYIENTLKTKISYNVSMRFGDKQENYLDFTKYVSASPLDRKQVINKVLDELSKNKNNYSVKHYKDNHSFTPSWIATKALYFGTTLNWYKVLPAMIKEEICKEYFKFSLIKDKEEQKELTLVILNLLHEYRNNIAHGSRTFLSNVSCELSKDLLLKAVTQDVLTEEEFLNGFGKKDLFAVIISIALLINDPTLFEQYLVDLSTITLKYQNLDLKISPKGNIYQTLNLPEHFVEKITALYNMKFTK